MVGGAQGRNGILGRVRGVGAGPGAAANSPREQLITGCCGAVLSPQIIRR